MTSRKQKTIKYPVSCTGVGLHTGVQSTITFNPAPEDFGIKFSRTDKKDIHVTPDIDNVVDLTRWTTIQENGVKVHTTEHVLSACAGMGVDNLLIELNSKDKKYCQSIKFIRYFLESFNNNLSDERNKYFYDNYKKLEPGLLKTLDKHLVSDCETESKTKPIEIVGYSFGVYPASYFA